MNKKQEELVGGLKTTIVKITSELSREPPEFEMAKFIQACERLSVHMVSIAEHHVGEDFYRHVALMVRTEVGQELTEISRRFIRRYCNKAYADFSEAEDAYFMQKYGTFVTELEQKRASWEALHLKNEMSIRALEAARESQAQVVVKKVKKAEKTNDPWNLFA